MTDRAHSGIRWSFLILVPLIAAGLAVNALTMFVLGRATPMSLAFGTAVSVLVIAVLWWLLSRSRLWRPAGAWPLLPLAWGALASFVFIAVTGDAMTVIAGGIGWESAEGSLAGAWPEEVGKTLGIALILLALPRLWHRPWDGLLVGIFVGLGFELIETVQYGAAGALADANSDADGMLFMWFVRAVAGPGLHVFFSGVAGFGVGVALLHPRLTTPTRWLIGLGATFAAFVMHFLWNYAWPSEWGAWPFGVMWFLWLAALIWCWISAKRLAGEWGRMGGA
ncbi:PrsW family intramembrane metalloprotease [Corynebacterium sp. NPDC060344]|uniref:PrsW family intramembrane metalloprotease n=1 Tax=Corynebacterium sp. NPDC060344 TaxID=3347101 RepID=UPI00364C639B